MPCLPYVSAQFYLHNIVNYAHFRLPCILIALQKTDKKKSKGKKTDELIKFNNHLVLSPTCNELLVFSRRPWLSLV